MSRHQLLQLGKERCKGLWAFVENLECAAASSIGCPCCLGIFSILSDRFCGDGGVLSLCLDRLYSNQLCRNSIATEKLSTKGKSSKVYRNSGKQTNISKTQLHTASSRLAGVWYQNDDSTGRQSTEERAA